MKAIKAVLVRPSVCAPETYYWRLPATAEAYDKMVNQIHEAIACDPDYQSIAHHQWLDLSVTALRSIGITRPRK